MENAIEQRIKRLRRQSLTEEMANRPDEFGWWIVAQYGEELLFRNDPSLFADAAKYVEQLASYLNWDYHGVLHQVRENYLLYLQVRADRIGSEERDSTQGQFIGYAIGARGYASKVVEALDDHLGLEPEGIKAQDLRVVSKLYDRLHEIHELIEPYGYGLERSELPST
ncbi:hypothetical protein [Cerasicoccus maritimus]|uniref:hypothetical protein n=1 Tax=Cerasicoccus maritimus TaxID=490089 RepID=UPI002852A984|nr:hypothetical protein [Cerasicoccus maritimus]